MYESLRTRLSASHLDRRAMNRFALAVLSLGTSVGSAVAGQFTYISQSRTVAAGASDDLNGITVDQSFSAPDFGPFNQTASASVGLGSGSATMESTLDPLLGIRVQISVSSTGSSNFQQSGGAMGSFSAVFDVTETTQGFVELPFWPGGGGVGLDGPEGWVAPFDHLSGPFPLPSTPVTFFPGRYFASASVMLGATNGGNGDAVAIYITIPTPGTAALLAAPLLALLRRRRA
jgi:uncharacterized protein (TIGR03382 family)